MGWFGQLSGNTFFIPQKGMNFGGHFLWITCILMIHFNFVILTEPSSKQAADTSGNANHPDGKLAKQAFRKAKF
jgi:hypothetical protein